MNDLILLCGGLSIILMIYNLFMMLLFIFYKYKRPLRIVFKMKDGSEKPMKVNVYNKLIEDHALYCILWFIMFDISLAFFQY